MGAILVKHTGAGILWSKLEFRFFIYISSDLGCVIWPLGLRFSQWNSIQFSSVTQWCPTLCDPMNGSTPGLPVHHHLPESAQTHIHRVGDAIQSSCSVVPFPSCPQSLPASESFPMSQLLSWGSQSTGVSALASVLPKNTQDWSPLGWTVWTSLQSKGLARVFSNTTVQKHQFFGAQLSSQSNSHTHTWALEKIIALTRRTLSWLDRLCLD